MERYAKQIKGDGVETTRNGKTYYIVAIQNNWYSVRVDNKEIAKCIDLEDARQVIWTHSGGGNKIKAEDFD